MNRVKRFRMPALLAVAVLMFGMPSAPGVSWIWAPSLGDAWATPCNTEAGPQSSTDITDPNDPCNERPRIVDILADVFAWLWTSVNTALGMIYGAMGVVGAWLTGATFDVYYGNGAVNFAGTSFLPPRAITLGNTIHYRVRKDAERCYLREHEGYHVFQYRRLGPGFIPIYVTVWAATGFNYDEHPMEETAHDHAVEQCATP